MGYLSKSTTGRFAVPAGYTAGGQVTPAVHERRRSQRIRTVFRIAKVARDRVVGLWRVRNISDFGMMLLTGAKASRGDRLTIALSDSVEVEAKVVWCGQDCYGVAFDAPIDSAQLLKSLVAEQGDPQHRAPRLRVELHATAYAECGIQPIRVQDVSQNGIGFSHDGRFTPGMRTLILFENGLERRGIVRWSHENRAGLHLIEPFSCAELDSVEAGWGAPAQPSPGSEALQ